jgi:ribosomal protein S18 acetylase RimI-like enzyme
VPELTVRPATDDDHDFLWAMLYEAAHWRHDAERPAQQEALREPQLRRYLDDWGREGDRALVACSDDEPMAAAWYRLFDEEEPGHGFVDPTTPEVSLAVVAAARRLGVGRALLAALLVQARLDGYLAVSLSVERDNPAMHLYEELGFTEVEVDGAVRTMINRFALR